MEVQDLNQASALCRLVFLDCVAPLYSESGVALFCDYVKPEEWIQRQADGCPSWLAENDAGQLLGVLHFRGKGHISLFFVATEHQRAGFGRRLFEQALSELDVSEITAHSSPNAVEAYRKLGFMPTDAERSEAGLRYVPMRMDVKRR